MNIRYLGHGGVASLKGKAYFTGGEYDHFTGTGSKVDLMMTNDVTAYSVAYKTISIGPTMLCGRRGHGCCSHTMEEHSQLVETNIRLCQ